MKKCKQKHVKVYMTDEEYEGLKDMLKISGFKSMSSFLHRGMAIMCIHLFEDRLTEAVLGDNREKLEETPEIQ